MFYQHMNWGRNEFLFPPPRNNFLYRVLIFFFTCACVHIFLLDCSTFFCCYKVKQVTQVRTQSVFLIQKKPPEFKVFFLVMPPRVLEGHLSLWYFTEFLLFLSEILGRLWHWCGAADSCPPIPTSFKCAARVKPLSIPKCILFESDCRF